MKFLNYFAVASTAVMVLVGCNKEDLTSNASVEAQSLTAIAPDADVSKLSFTSSGSTLGADGITVNWASGDEITIYKYNADKSASERVGNFIAGGAGTTVEFTAESGVTLNTTDEYVAVYPASVMATLAERDADAPSAVTQTVRSDSYAHLDQLCWMKSNDFNFSSDDTAISFAHEKAVLTFYYYITCNNTNTGGSPDALSVTLGDNIYTLNLYDSWVSNGRYVSLMVDPQDLTDTDITVDMWMSQARLYRGTETITTEFVAGGSYVKTLDFPTDANEYENAMTMVQVDFTDDGYSSNLADLTTDESEVYWEKMKQTNVWILDFGTKAASAVSANLAICMENMSELDVSRDVIVRMQRQGWSSLSGTGWNCDRITEIHCSGLQSIGSYAFQNLPNLEYFSAGSMKELNAYMFNREVTAPVTLSIVNQWAAWSIDSNTFKIEGEEEDIDLTKVTINLSSVANDAVTIVNENGEVTEGGLYWKVSDELTFGPFAAINLQ